MTGKITPMLSAEPGAGLPRARGTLVPLYSSGLNMGSVGPLSLTSPPSKRQRREHPSQANSRAAEA